MSYFYPAVFKLQGRCCLVVGGGTVAARKAASLIECGADVRLVSPHLTEELEREVERGKINYIKRGFEKVDLEGVYMVICATDNAELNRKISEYCEALHIPVNVVDNPELSSFYVPSVIQRGPLSISITTGGNSPLFARRLREELEEEISQEYGELVMLLGQMRCIVQEQIHDPSRRRKALEDILPPGSLADLDEEKMESLRRRVKECISSLLE
ncbi:MAG TPA: bifunctional precorrin-2 dehydrogenase/sirohydrochlorin ferrochelatase [Syntrophomonadaceae bacterium]|nr:bifunctional precorrin-2 dehydrogenase/sirohydrochlorin ferrochelatase [Syntrophomonadaceae bacterium]